MILSSEISYLIPENITGKSVDLESTVKEDSIEAALTTYTRAKKRLLNPSIWNQLGGFLKASFELANDKLGYPERLAVIGDYIRIDIPGPGSAVGDGYDWVFIEDIFENKESNAQNMFAIKLKVSVNPTKPDEEIAHFFKTGASSTFIIKQSGVSVTASYYGRNEQPNIEKGKFSDKIRNAVIAGGALAGLASLQWKAFINGLLEKEIGG